MKLLCGLVSIALVAAACSSAGEPQTAAEATSDSSIESTTSTADLEEVDESASIEPLDPASATSVDSLLTATADEDGAMPPGVWYENVFASPILFELPTPTLLAQRFDDLLILEIGSVGNVEGLLEIIEPSAYVGADGPIPLGQLAADEAWGGASILGSGSGQGVTGPFTWVDVLYESDNIETNRTFPCPYTTSNPCLEAFVLNNSALVAELDRPHRYVSLTVDGSQLIVMATSLDGGTIDTDQLALDVATSITPTDEIVEADGPQPLAGLVGSDSIPAGTYSATIAGSPLTITIDEEIVGLSVLLAVDEVIAIGDETQTNVLEIADFGGFVPDVDARPDSPDEPFTADEFRSGMEQIVAVTGWEEIDFAGVAAVSFDLALEHDPAFDCSESERQLYRVETGDQCFLWALASGGEVPWVSGEFKADSWSDIYIESLGVIWSFPTGVNDPDGHFATIVAGSSLAPN